MSGKNYTLLVQNPEELDSFEKRYINSLKPRPRWLQVLLLYLLCTAVGVGGFLLGSMNRQKQAGLPPWAESMRRGTHHPEPFPTDPLFFSLILVN